MHAAPLPYETQTLRDQIGALQQALEDARRENPLLRQKLDALARRFFGKKSEQLDAAQLQLLLQGLAQLEAQPAPQKSLLPFPLGGTPRRARTNTQRIRAPENLEVVREVIEPQIVQAQPQHWKRISQEVSRLLDYQPGKFFWRETVRPKYRRIEQRLLPPIIAPAPAPVADHSLAAPGLLAHLLVSKYADHLPFYRLHTIFGKRHGVFIARQQVVMWTGQCVLLLEGIVVCIRRGMQASPYVQADETPAPYLNPDLPRPS